MPNIGPVELIIILVIALLILGPGRLPDVGSALGKSIREFRKAATDVQDAAKVDATPATTAPAAPSAPAPAAVPAPNTLAAQAEPNTLVAPVAVPVAPAELVTEPAPAAPAELVAEPAPAEPAATTAEPKA